MTRHRWSGGRVQVCERCLCRRLRGRYLPATAYGWDLATRVRPACFDGLILAGSHGFGGAS